MSNDDRLHEFSCPGCGATIKETLRNLSRQNVSCPECKAQIDAKELGEFTKGLFDELDAGFEKQS